MMSRVKELKQTDNHNFAINTFLLPKKKYICSFKKMKIL